MLRYVGWSNCDQESEEELSKYFFIPNFFHPSTFFGSKTWFFIGTPGYGAPSHIDQVALPSWQAQVLLICHDQALPALSTISDKRREVVEPDTSTRVLVDMHAHGTAGDCPLPWGCHHHQHQLVVPPDKGLARRCQHYYY